MDQLRQFFGNLTVQVGGFFARLNPPTNLCQTTVPVASSVPVSSSVPPVPSVSYTSTDLSGAVLSLDVSGSSIISEVTVTGISGDSSIVETVKANCALPCPNSASCLCTGDESDVYNLKEKKGVTVLVSLPVELPDVKFVDKPVGLKLLVPETKVD